MKLCTYCFLNYPKELSSCPQCCNDEFIDNTDEMIDMLLEYGYSITAAGYMTKFKNMTIEQAAQKCNLGALTKVGFYPLKTLISHLLKQNSSVLLSSLVRELNHSQFNWDLKMSKEFVDYLFEANQ